MVQPQQFDGFMPMWLHATCIMKKASEANKNIKLVDDVVGIESLRWEDQQKLRKYIEASRVSSNMSAIAPARASAPKAYGIEVSQTSRAMCKRCGQKIAKGEVRDLG